VRTHFPEVIKKMEANHQVKKDPHLRKTTKRLVVMMETKRKAQEADLKKEVLMQLRKVLRKESHRVNRK
jgi:hypothetical protein